MEHPTRQLPDEARQSFGRVQERGRRRAPIRPKATSPACAARKWAFIIGSAAIGSKPTRTKWRGARTIAGSPTATHWNLITAAALAHPKSADVGRLLAPGEGGMTDHETHGRGELPSSPSAPRSCLRSANWRSKIERLRTELVHLDAVLRMFRPDFKAEGLPVRHRRPTKSPYFAHGELTKRIFDAMREQRRRSPAWRSPRPRCATRGSIPTNDPVTRTDFVRRVGAATQRHGPQGQGREDRARARNAVAVFD